MKQQSCVGDTASAGPAGARPAGRKRVAVLGGGFSGIVTALEIDRLARKYSLAVDVILIDYETDHVYKPMLHEVSTGSIAPIHIRKPIMSIIEGTGIWFINGVVDKIDLKTKTVKICSDCRTCSMDLSSRVCRDFPELRGIVAVTKKMELDVDTLVVAMGSHPNFFGTPGADEFAYTMLTIPDAERIKNRILESIELAALVPDGKTDVKKRLVTFTVVGAGPSGTELSIEIREYAELIIAKYYPGSGLEKLLDVRLIEAMDGILPGMPEKLVRTALARLEAKGVNVMTGRKVAEIRRAEVILVGGEAIQSYMLVWTAGVRANDVVAESAGSKGHGGRIEVDAHLEAIGFPGVFAIGDNAMAMDKRTGKPLPPTAQVAVQEGKVAARNVIASYTGEPMEEFSQLSFGTIISVGKKFAVAYLFRFVIMSGVLAWLAWKLVYLKHLMSIGGKGRALIDWLFDITLDRDTSRYRLD